MESSPAAPSETRLFVEREREALADSLSGFGPDAPTILDGWNASELLDHLLVREHAVIAQATSRSPIAPLRASGRAALEGMHDLTWSQQVARFRQGHPRLSPLHVADRWMNSVEYLVHHEDLLRARTGWDPRPLDPTDERFLWRQLRLFSRLMIRGSVDVTLVSGLGGIRVKASRGVSVGSVRVHGTTTELLLWAFGRDRVAQVRIEGDADALLALRDGDRGI